MHPDSEHSARDGAEAGGLHGRFDGRIGRRELLRRVSVTLPLASGLLAACSPTTAVAPTSPPPVGTAPTTAPATVAAKPAASPSAAAAASAVPSASPAGAAPSPSAAASPA